MSGGDPGAVNADAEDAAGQFGPYRFGFGGEAETDAESVVLLDAFQLEGLPIGSDGPGPAAGDDQLILKKDKLESFVGDFRHDGGDLDALFVGVDVVMGPGVFTTGGEGEFVGAFHAADGGDHG